MNGLLRTAGALALCAFASLAQAQVYRCQDASGRTTYAGAPCAAGDQRLALPQGVNAGMVDATVCAQLRNETRRLAAEADGDARRGRATSATNAKRRQTLHAQYERRCAVIRRSPR